VSGDASILLDGARAEVRDDLTRTTVRELTVGLSLIAPRSGRWIAERSTTMISRTDIVAKAKTGNYAAGNGSKSSVELGWGGGAHGDSSYNLGLAGDFATNADGELETTVTQDEFDIDADAGGSGNDWLRAKYDAKSHVVTNTAAGYSTHHSKVAGAIRVTE
jgi:hypothetical protein